MSKRARRPSPPPKTPALVTLAAASLIAGACGGQDASSQPPQIAPQAPPVETGTPATTATATPTDVPPQAPPVPSSRVAPSSTASSASPAVTAPPPQVPPRPPQVAPRK